MSLVSVIIPTYNSSRTIEKCLESIKNQDFPDIEIIVVDNFSTDDTFDIAQRYTQNAFQKWPERTAQKNYGIEKASGEYLCFIDSDMTLDEKIISECVSLWESEKNIWGICIPEKTVWEGFFVQVRDFERSFYEWTSVESARFFLKDNVVQVWWFEEDLIFFEESLLPQKIESKLWKSTKYRIESFISHDESGIKLWKWLKKKYYYGQSLQHYKRKVTELGIMETWEGQMGIIGRYMIFLKNPRFYKKPILAFSVLLLKTWEFGSGALWLIFSKK